MTFPVNESVVQNPWISSAASAATYTKTNAATGAETCPSVLRRGRRHVNRDRARRAPPAGAPSSIRAGSAAKPACYPLTWVQAVVQARRSMQFFCPLPQSATGVFQNLIER